MTTLEKSRSNSKPNWIGILKGWQSKPDDIARSLVHIGPQQLATHALVIGATGSGKTNLLHHLIAQDIERGHSVCVLDLRGDLVTSVLEMCLGRVPHERVDIIDPRIGNPTSAFDPLFGAGDPSIRALGVLKAIEMEAGSSWGIQLAETLRNALILFGESGESLTKLDQLFHNRGFRLECLLRCSDQPVIDFWKRYDQFSSDQQQAMAMPVLNKISLLLASRAMRELLDGVHVTDIGQSINAPGRVILISLAVDQLHGAGRMLGRMAIASICREIFARVDVAERERVPVRLYVDEFSNFGDSEFETIIAEGRRFKFSLVLAHQTLVQLTPRMRSMVLNNVGAKFVFASGRNDAQTIAQDLYGMNEPEQIQSLKTGECLLWLRNFGVIPIEVNAPIIRNVGQRSHAAQLYARSSVECKRARAPLGSPRRHEGPIVTPIDSEGDWLCG